MEQPLVTVICACYNQSKFVIESLESVKNQTYKNLEIIISDDFSKDNSVEKIEGWISQNSNLNINFIKNEKNLGICKSLNNCYRKATGKYIQLLALDDLMCKDKIERHVILLEKSSDTIGLIFTDAHLMDDNGVLSEDRFISHHKKNISLKSRNFFEDLLAGNFVPAMSVLYKRKVLEKIGLWDEELFFEDYDMLLRIARNYDFIFDDNISVKYRIHGTNTHKKYNKEMIESEFKIIMKYAGYNKTANNYLKKHIIKKFLNNELAGEQIIFFAKVPPKNLREHWILENKNIFLYKLLQKLATVKNVLLYRKS